jgi:hypothetical protein
VEFYGTLTIALIPKMDELWNMTLKNGVRWIENVTCCMHMWVPSDRKFVTCNVFCSCVRYEYENDFWRCYSNEHLKKHWTEFHKYFLRNSINSYTNIPKAGYCPIYQQEIATRWHAFNEVSNTTPPFKELY